MMTKLLILLLPALAVAKIKIKVRGELGSEPAAGDKKIQFDYTGLERHVVSDLERSTFKIGDDNLKNAVRSYIGARPDDAFVREPTPWGGLYPRHNWTQVYRSVWPVSVKLMHMERNPQLVKTHIFENNSSHATNIDVAISQEVENTFTTSWSEGGELSLNAEIEFAFMNTGASFSASQTSSWAKSQLKTDSVKIGSSSGIEITLQPEQSVLTELRATHGIMGLKVEYEASLSGNVVVNYKYRYSGHHFWSFSIEELMDIARINNKLRYVEQITFNYYSDSKVTVLGWLVSCLCPQT